MDGFFIVWFFGDGAANGNWLNCGHLRYAGFYCLLATISSDSASAFLLSTLTFGVPFDMRGVRSAEFTNCCSLLNDGAVDRI